MFTEKLSLSATEENLLHETIGKKLLRISMMKPTDYGVQALLPLYADFGNVCFRITRTDEVIQYFDMKEDAGRPTISKATFCDSGCIKNINREVQDVLVVTCTFKFTNYEITYPKAFIFKFADCNLVAEKTGLTSMSELNSRLEALDAENFGLEDEMSFWYDPAEDNEKPSISQQIKSIRQNKIVSNIDDLRA